VYPQGKIIVCTNYYRVFKAGRLKSLSREELKQVADELRQAIIDNLSKTGGTLPPTWAQPI